MHLWTAYFEAWKIHHWICLILQQHQRLIGTKKGGGRRHMTSHWVQWNILEILGTKSKESLQSKCILLGEVTSLMKESFSIKNQPFFLFFFFFTFTTDTGSLENLLFWWLKSCLHLLSKHELRFHLSALSYSFIWLFSSLLSNKYIYRDQSYPFSGFCLARQKLQSFSLSTLSGGSPVCQPLQLHLSPVLAYFIVLKWQRLYIVFQIRPHSQTCKWHHYFFFLL